MEHKKETFEESFARLSQAASAMGDSALTLTEKIDLYRKGAAAAKTCFSILGEAETDVNHISEEIEAMLREADHVEGHTEDKTESGK